MIQLNLTMVTGYQSDSYSTNVIYEYDSDEKLDFEHYYQKSLNLGLCKYDIKYQFKKIYREYAPNTKDKLLDPDDLESFIEVIPELKYYFENEKQLMDGEIKEDYMVELTPELFAKLYIYTASLSIKLEHPNFSYKLAKDKLIQKICFNTRSF